MLEVMKVECASRTSEVAVRTSTAQVEFSEVIDSPKKSAVRDGVSLPHLQNRIRKMSSSTDLNVKNSDLNSRQKHEIL